MQMCTNLHFIPFLLQKLLLLLCLCFNVAKAKWVSHSADSNVIDYVLSFPAPCVHLAFMDWCKFFFLWLQRNNCWFLSFPESHRFIVSKELFSAQNRLWYANYNLKGENYLKAALKDIAHVMVWLNSCCAGLRHLWPFGLLTLFHFVAWPKWNNRGGHFKLIHTD